MDSKSNAFLSSLRVDEIGVAIHILHQQIIILESTFCDYSVFIAYGLPRSFHSLAMTKGVE
ncbi:hypothetical protein [Helicobacter canis]|uniref:hypothetical protein n=1 Tax=Helicobacter canis TaxID=29419 RepID=UPI0011C04B03|nr:hypothetical protein [Helicobacter canis]